MKVVLVLLIMLAYYWQTEAATSTTTPKPSTTTKRVPCTCPENKKHKAAELENPIQAPCSSSDGEGTCVKLCEELIETAKAKGPQVICKMLNNYQTMLSCESSHEKTLE